jgi:hypothetical protein
MTYVTIDVDGNDSDAFLNRLALGLLDLRPFWPMIVPLFIGWMRSQFETQGAFGGAPWAPLSPNYYAWKQATHPGKGILVLEGDLRQAASNPIRETTPTSLTLRIEDPKVGYHQTGTARMPARPLIFTALPAVASAQVDYAARQYVEQLLASSERRG